MSRLVSRIGNVTQRDISLLESAVRYAVRNDDGREFVIGTLGIRSDGAIVMSRNGVTNSDGREKVSGTHAERRLSRKLGIGATVYIVRVAAGGRWANAKPCGPCMSILKNKRVKRIVYTMADDVVVSERIY